MLNNIKTDIKRKMQIYLKEKTFLNRIKLLLQQGTMAVVVFRFGNWSYKLSIPVARHLLLFIYHVLNIMIMMFSGINIQCRAEIGGGFVIHNFSCIFIGATKIGENCTVQQGVTIGNIRGSAHRPVIGNNVYFGAGCKVLGPITIGDNVVIGANSLVITNVPANCTVIGVPARVISDKPQSEYLKFA